jgi:predicted nuclease of predicted toxin-antitoxin system
MSADPLRLLVDMALSWRVADALRGMGHDAQHVSERGLHRAPDTILFQLAHGEQRIVLTADLGFSAIAMRSRDTPTSVIVLRLANLRASVVVERLRPVLPACAESLRQGAVVVVEEHRVRIRALPLGVVRP